MNMVVSTSIAVGKNVGNSGVYADYRLGLKTWKLACEVNSDHCLKEEGLEEVCCMAYHIQKNCGKVNRKNCPKKSSSKRERNAYSFDILRDSFLNGILLDVVLGEFLRSKVLKEARGERQELLTTSSQLQDHETSLGIKWIPSHVIVTEEVDVVKTTECDGVF